jgi:hypothetical protein
MVNQSEMQTDHSPVDLPMLCFGRVSKQILYTL